MICSPFTSRTAFGFAGGMSGVTGWKAGGRSRQNRQQKMRICRIFSTGATGREPAIGTLVTLSEREAEELQAAAAADAGRSSARRDLALLLERALRRRTTVALNRAEARELAELLTSGGFAANPALLGEALRQALEGGPG
jgi:hypothetical protein